MNLTNKEGDNIFTGIEKEKVFQFNEDPDMKSAIKKVILYSIYYQGTLKAGEEPVPERNFVFGVTNNRSLSDEEIGKAVKIFAEAIGVVQTAFQELEKYKRPEKEEETENPAI